MKTILFLGDSITDAGRSRDSDRNLGCGYANLVAAQLGLDQPGSHRFYNRGISGNRVIDLLGRVRPDVLKLEPDYMSILIGVNDVWHELEVNNGVEERWFEVYYDLLVQQVKEQLPSCRIFLLEPFVLRGTATAAHWDYFRREVEARAAATCRVASKHGLPFLPLQALFDQAATQAPENHWLYDGVHPTAAGHALIKQEWLRVFACLQE